MHMQTVISLSQKLLIVLCFQKNGYFGFEIITGIVTNMNEVKKSISLGVGIILISSFFYASYGIWTKLMGDFFGGYSATALRSLLVLIILIPLAIWRHELKSFDYKKNSKSLILLTLFSALVWGPLYYAVLKAGIGLSLTINYAAIVVGLLLLGKIFDGEKFTKEKQWSAFFGIIGLVIIFAPTFGTNQHLLPLIAALISGFAVAANIIILKGLPYSTTQSTISLWIASVISNIPLAFILNEPLPAISMHIEWLYLLAFAIASVIASWLMLRGVEHIGAGLAGIVGLSEIVFSVIFGVILFNEDLTQFMIIGIALIMLAAGLPYIKSKFSTINEAC